MSRPVYSAAFIQANAYVGGGLSFDVPVGYVAVIREFDLYSVLGGTVAALEIAGAGAGFAIVVASLEAAGVAASKQWTGRVVAGPEYTISVTTGGLAVNDCVYVGGYLLTAD